MDGRRQPAQRLDQWLETGRHHLAGPLGTMLVYLTLPIFDQMGRELVQSAIRVACAG